MFRPTLFGKYLLTHRLAVGGMAEIFKAKVYGVGGFEKDLVVKQILPQYARYREFVEMFIDEAKITVSLNHGNIVPVYELGRIEGIYFIAMEYVQGRDLSQVLMQARELERPMDPEFAVAIAIDVLRGLDYAHRRKDRQGRSMGIVHRDVSPQNVMVSFDGEIKLLDFGIAKAAQKLSRTHPGVIRGKFSYLSPEMARGEPVDRRSDIFSAGVVLWESLTNRRLFSAQNEAEVLRRIAQAEVDPPSLVRPQIPEELDRLVLKALAGDREKRYKDAASFQLALSKFLYTSRGAVTSESIGEYMRGLFADQIAAEDETEQDPGHQERVQRLCDELTAKTRTNATDPGVPRSTRPPRRPRRATEPGVGVTPRLPTRPFGGTPVAADSTPKDQAPRSTIPSTSPRTGRVTTGPVVPTGPIGTGPIDTSAELDDLLSDLAPAATPEETAAEPDVEPLAEEAALDYEVFASRSEDTAFVAGSRRRSSLAWIAVTIVLLSIVGWLLFRRAGSTNTGPGHPHPTRYTADVVVRVHPHKTLSRDGRVHPVRLYWYQGDTPLTIRDLPCSDTNDLRIELAGYRTELIALLPRAFAARSGPLRGSSNTWERRLRITLHPGSGPPGHQRIDRASNPGGGPTPPPTQTAQVVLDTHPAGASVWLLVGTGFRGEHLDPRRPHRFLAILPGRGRRILAIRPFRSPDEPGDWTVLPGTGRGVRFRGEIDFDEEQ